jgi:hypothetical protein
LEDVNVSVCIIVEVVAERIGFRKVARAVAVGEFISEGGYVGFYGNRWLADHNKVIVFQQVFGRKGNGAIGLVVAVQKQRLGQAALAEEEEGLGLLFFSFFGFDEYVDGVAFVEDLQEAVVLVGE